MHGCTPTGRNVPGRTFQVRSHEVVQILDVLTNVVRVCAELHLRATVSQICHKSCGKRSPDASLVPAYRARSTVTGHRIQHTSLRTRMLCFFAEAKFFCGCFLAMLRSEKPPSMVPKPLAIQCTCDIETVSRLSLRSAGWAVCGARHSSQWRADVLSIRGH